MSPISRRQWLQYSAAASLAGALPAYVFGAQAANADGTPARGGVLVVAQYPEPTILTTAVIAAGATNNISPKIFDSLLTYDLQLNPQPLLAKSWSVSDDGLTITFHLREGVKWHDGVPFTSADVAFSLTEVWQKLNSRGKSLYANVVAVDTPDDLTVIWRLSKPAPYILNSQASYISQILPKHIYEGTDILTNPANVKPIGTGPFKFAEWSRGNYLRLERNPDYWDAPRPYLDQVVYRFLPDAAGRGAALETGDVQLVGETAVPANDLARLARDPNFELELKGYELLGLVQFFAFNLEKPVFQDVRVRRAFAHAIDQSFLIKNIWHGYGKAATGPIPSDQSAFYTADVPRYAFDPERAKQLLDEAGLKPDANGVRLTITHDYAASAEQLQRAAEYLREALGNVGIKVQVRNQDFAAFARRVYTERDFDTATYYTSTGPDPAVGVQRVYWSKAFQKGVSFSNTSGYANAEVDQALEAAQIEADAKKRAALYHTFQQVVQQDLPEIPLVEVQHVTLSSQRVKQHSINAEGTKGNFAAVYLVQP